MQVHCKKIARQVDLQGMIWWWGTRLHHRWFVGVWWWTIYIYSILSIFLGRTFWRETNVLKNQHNSRSCVSQLRAFSCLSGGHCSVFQSNFWNTEATGNSFQLVFFLADLFRSSGPWERLGTAGGVSRRWPPHAADPAENWNDWAISPMPAAVTLEGWAICHLERALEYRGMFTITWCIPVVNPQVLGRIPNGFSGFISLFTGDPTWPSFATYCIRWFIVKNVKDVKVSETNVCN